MGIINVPSLKLRFAPEKMAGAGPKRKLIFQTQCFRCDLLVSGRPYLQILFFSTVILVFWGGRCGELGFQEIPVKSSICWLRVCFAKNMGVINFGVRDGIGVIVSPTQTKYSISSGKSLKFYYTFEHQLWIPPRPPKKKLVPISWPTFFVVSRSCSKEQLIQRYPTIIIPSSHPSGRHDACNCQHLKDPKIQRQWIC